MSDIRGDTAYNYNPLLKLVIDGYHTTFIKLQFFNYQSIKDSIIKMNPNLKSSGIGLGLVLELDSNITSGEISLPITEVCEYEI